MSKLASALIGLGTNLPFAGVEGPELLARAVSVLREADLNIRAVSGVWRTPSWPVGSDQPDFHNAAVELDPGQLGPRQLYDVLREVEARFGRERRERWGPRTLDLDILAMEGFQGDFGTVRLPHARLHERAFVLAPLIQIAPDWRHPQRALTASEMWSRLPEAERQACRVVT